MDADMVRILQFILVILFLTFYTAVILKNILVYGNNIAISD